MKVFIDLINLINPYKFVAQYSRRELIGIPTSVKGDVLKEKVCGIFHELGVEICQRDFQTCHRIKNNRVMVENGSVKNITHVNDLNDLFPDINIGFITF